MFLYKISLQSSIYKKSGISLDIPIYPYFIFRKTKVISNLEPPTSKHPR